MIKQAGTLTASQIAVQLREIADAIEQKAIYVYESDIAFSADAVNTGDDGAAYTFAATGKKNVSLNLSWQEIPARPVEFLRKSTANAT